MDTGEQRLACKADRAVIGVTCYRAATQPFAGRFASDALMRAAEQATGLSDWGGKRWEEERFRSNLSVLCNCVEEAADFSPLGRSRMHSRLFTMLVSRLRYLDARNATRDVDAQAILRPLVGTGMARAGTTFLHGLLAADPSNKVVRAYEAAMPAPLLVDGHDIRADIYQQILDFQGQTQPHVWDVHPFDARLPEECIFLKEGSCNSLYTTYIEAPAFAQALEGHAAIEYAYQIGVMQYLQALDPGKQWLLKAPVHLFCWDEFLMAFPDARIYVNHRDPGKSVPSIASLIQLLRELFSSAPHDPKMLGEAQIATWDLGLNGYARWRADRGRDACVIDIEYCRMIADPMATVEEVYDRFELPLSRVARTAMQRHLDTDHHVSAPKRPYTLAQFGITEAMIENTFGAYIAQFGITRERRDQDVPSPHRAPVETSADASAGVPHAAARTNAP